jgi:hypothetical protein
MCVDTLHKGENDNDDDDDDDNNSGKDNFHPRIGHTCPDGK